VRLRTASPRDAAPIAAIYRPVVERTGISFELEPPSPEEMAERIERTLARWPWLVAVDGFHAPTPGGVEGEVLGYAYASSFRAREAYRFVCETTVYVAESARRRGVARRLYGALLDVLREQGFAMAYAGIALPNDPSVRAHEAVGFTKVGVFARAGFKLGRSWDVGFWELALAPSPPPREPLLYAAFREDASHGAILARHGETS